MEFRYFNKSLEDPKPILDLYQKTWKTNALSNRWNWEYNDYPLDEKTKILIAEMQGNIIASTTRSPFKLRIDNSVKIAYFSTNSMVDPKYRGQGIMAKLYLKASERMPILYSKGSSNGMYKLLMKIGYKPLKPNTHLVCLLNPIKWALWRLNLLNNRKFPEMFSCENNTKLVLVKRFGCEFDKFFDTISVKFEGSVYKDANYMNWRYIDIPHQKYISYYKINNDKISMLIVLRKDGHTCRIVDLLCSINRSEDLFFTLRDIKRLARRAGFIKISCWCTHHELRKIFKRLKFIDRNEVIPFSLFCKPELFSRFSEIERFHFVEGDGDSEYIR